MCWVPTATALAGHAPRYGRRALGRRGRRCRSWARRSRRPGRHRRSPARRFRSRPTQPAAGLGIAVADRGATVRPGRRRRGPASPGRGAARAAQRGPAATASIAIGAHHHAAQSDPAVAGPAVLLRPQSRRGARASCRRTSRHCPDDRCPGSRPPPRPGSMRWPAESPQAATPALADVAAAMGVPLDLPPITTPSVPVSPPPLKSRRLEMRLTMVFGAVFGLGVALTLSRLIAGLTPD